MGKSAVGHLAHGKPPPSPTPTPPLEGRGFYRAGKVSTNRAPCPGALSTVISPPIARASRREM